MHMYVCMCAHMLRYIFEQIFTSAEESDTHTLTKQVSERRKKSKASCQHPNRKHQESYCTLNIDEARKREKRAIRLFLKG